MGSRSQNILMIFLLRHPLLTSKKLFIILINNLYCINHAGKLQRYQIKQVPDDRIYLQDLDNLDMIPSKHIIEQKITY